MKTGRVLSSLLGAQALLGSLAACGDDDMAGDDSPLPIDASLPVDAPADEPDAPTAVIDAAPLHLDAGPPADAAPGGFIVVGPVIGPMVPAFGDAVVVWTVSVGDDSAYKFGDGVQLGAMYEVEMPGDLPLAARNVIPGQHDFGVGLVALLPDNSDLPDGPITDKPPRLRGLSARHAIIYRGAGDTGAILPWTADFPVGWSCGVCVDGAPGDFDSFAPIDCGQVAADTDSTTEVCNWT